MHKKFNANIPIRFRDIDSMGHVNNSVYFTFFEEARKEFFSSILNVKTHDGHNIILAHISCDFKKPILLTDPITVQLWVGEIGKKKFDFIYRIVNRADETVIYATGHSVQVCYDYQKNATIPIPQNFLEKIQEYAE